MLLVSLPCVFEPRSLTPRGRAPGTTAQPSCTPSEGQPKAVVPLAPASLVRIEASRRGLLSGVIIEGLHQLASLSLTAAALFS